MEIERAYEVLEQNYTKNELENLYRTKKFDNSETDTIRKHKYNGELLRGKASNVQDDDKKQELLDAANCFEELARTEERNR